MSTRLSRISALVLIALGVLLVTGCAQIKPSELPKDQPMVVVKDWQFSPNANFPQVTAHHAFIDVRNERGKLTRYEVRNREQDTTRFHIEEDQLYQDERKTRSINVRALVTGPKAAQIIQDLERNRLRYEARMVNKEMEDPMAYTPWPGPNSNTFVAWMLRETPDLHAVLPHLCYGKDFDSTVLAGISDSGDGLEFETALLGAEIGLRKGVELHVAALTFGVSLFPPAIKIPGLPPIGWQPAVYVDRSEEYTEMDDKE